jgi:hypothetical protein
MQSVARTCVYCMPCDVSYLDTCKLLISSLPSLCSYVLRAGNVSVRWGEWRILRCPYTYQSGSQVRLGELDSGARLVYISPHTHEWMTLHTRTSLTHWNPRPARLASQTCTCMDTFTPIEARLEFHQIPLVCWTPLYATTKDITTHQNSNILSIIMQGEH